jgi:Fe-S-cluster-containing dehydrogenase component
MSTCKYCNSSNFGGGCPYSPSKYHEHNGDEKKCEFCDSSNYGGGCPYSHEKNPTKIHER